MLGVLRYKELIVETMVWKEKSLSFSNFLTSTCFHERLIIQIVLEGIIRRRLANSRVFEIPVCSML
jgi:hypothetical protein